MKKSILLYVLCILLMVIVAVAAIIIPKLLCPPASLTAAQGLTDSRDQIDLPIIMYHGITNSGTDVNEYTILAMDFEEDLKWLGDQGFTTVTPSQIVNYVEKGAPLPSKPVLITFDDGYASNYSLAFPLLQKYHMKAVISVIGSQSDISSGDVYRNLYSSSLTWGEIAIMSSSGSVEIGNHTYDLHKNQDGRNGADKRLGESQEDYKAVLSADLMKNQEKIAQSTGQRPLLFAWPFGAYPADRSADQILTELGFKMTVTSYQKSNTIIKGDMNSLLGLRRFLRTPDFDMNKII